MPVMSASDTVLYPCTICENPDSSLCTVCQSIRYCSDGCKEIDRPFHGLLCDSFASFDLSSRPSQNHILGIEFPALKPKPELLWLKTFSFEHFGRQLGKEVGPNQFPIFASELGRSPITSVLIERNLVLQQKLTNSLYVTYRDDFMDNTSQPNQSIAALFAVKSGDYKIPGGPAFAHSLIGCKPDDHHGTCKDIDMNDFRHIFDHLCVYHTKPRKLVEEDIPTPLIQDGDDKMEVTGVVINCMGRRKLTGKTYEPVTVHFTDSVFFNHHQSKIATLAGLPILIQKHRAGPDSSHYENEDRCNTEASFLNICCDTRADTGFNAGLTWGRVIPEWEEDVGNVMVVRQDKKALLPIHVEALSDFGKTQTVFMEQCAIMTGQPTSPAIRHDAMMDLNRAGFENSWLTFLQHKRRFGYKVDNIPSPFHMGRSPLSQSSLVAGSNEMPFRVRGN